jgi:hypothetical protein
VQVVFARLRHLKASPYKYQRLGETVALRLFPLVSSVQVLRGKGTYVTTGKEKRGKKQKKKQSPGRWGAFNLLGTGTYLYKYMRALAIS